MQSMVRMEEIESLESIRQPWTLVIVYTVFYLAVFAAGLVGNVFVVLAVVLNTNLRSATDYLISSLALADLLIILFCLPTTLLNNLLTEWQLGAVGCKLSTFINSTTSCASIFTLVAVTADRYMAICHTLKYALWEARPVLYMILAIWVISAMLASPNLVLYDEILYDLLPPNGTLVARLCVSTQDDFLHFIIVNLVIAFLVPIVLISVSYALIFKTVTNHQSVAVAVDARIRDERIKLRVAQMMLTVIVLFMFCWSPLYGLYCYFFMASNRDSSFFQFASSVLRPIFQWLSLLSSSLNPLIYIAYSQKYRRAFHQLLLLPCRMHYQSFQRATRATLRLPPLHCSLAETDEQGGQVFDASKYSRKVSLQHHYFQPHEYTNGLMRKLSEQTSQLKCNYSTGAPRKYSPSPGFGSSPGVSPTTLQRPEAAPPKLARQSARHSLAVPSLYSSSVARPSIEESANQQSTMEPLIGRISSQLKLDLSQLDNDSETGNCQKCTAKLSSCSSPQIDHPRSVVLLRLSPVVAHI